MRLSTLLTKFHRGESGTAMTEFAIFLPVFATIYIAVADFYRVNRMPLDVQIEAQKRTWKAAFDASKSKSGSHMNLVSGANSVRTAAGGGRREKNANTISTGAHIASAVGMGVAGDVGEGIAMGILPANAAGEGSKVNVSPGDYKKKIYGNRDFPYRILQPGAASVANIKGGGGAFGAVMSAAFAALTGSGALHAYVAGQRYGSVAGEYNAQVDGFRVVGGGKFNFKTRYDVMVPPQALTDDKDRLTMPFVMARMGSFGGKDYDYYGVALIFGSADWPGSGSSSNRYTDQVSDAKDQADKDLEEGEKEAEEAKQQKKDDCEASYSYYQSNRSDCVQVGATEPPPPPPPPPANP